MLSLKTKVPSSKDTFLLYCFFLSPFSKKLRLQISSKPPGCKSPVSSVTLLHPVMDSKSWNDKNLLALCIYQNLILNQLSINYWKKTSIICYRSISYSGIQKVKLLQKMLQWTLYRTHEPWTGSARRALSGYVFQSTFFQVEKLKLMWIWSDFGPIYAKLAAESW